MPWSGFEPLRLSALPPQDSVSTSFTTRAESPTKIAAGSERVKPRRDYRLLMYGLPPIGVPSRKMFT